MAMDNMTVRKAQLEQLDKFVKQLYDETQMMKKYNVELPDLEMLYLHIHELIEELLQCNTSDEFMAMIQQLHQAIAGVLIVIAPASADQVKQDMDDTYEEFKGDNFDDFLNNLQKNAVSKFGSNQKAKNPKKQEQEEEVENDPDDLLKMMDLEDHVKPKPKTKKQAEVEAKREEAESEDDDADPFDDVYKNFK